MSSIPSPTDDTGELRKQIVNRLSKIQLYAKDSQEITASDEADIEQAADEIMQLIARPAQLAALEARDELIMELIQGWSGLNDDIDTIHKGAKSLSRKVSALATRLSTIQSARDALEKQG